jgi:hypothetical protein
METPVSRVWRFTPRDGNPMKQLTQTGTSVTLALAQGDVPAIIFVDAAIVRQVNGSLTPVSAVGMWINQSLNVPLPAGWKCELS